MHNLEQVNMSGYLEVGEGHKIFWQALGNKHGTPAVFLHGGPGSGIKSYHAPLFDLDKVFLILFDQRGCGRSQSVDPLVGNTTENIISDIEKLRCHFGIDKWWVVGHSWGSSLSVLYTGKHSDRCLGLIPISVFLAGVPDLDELYNEMIVESPEKWQELNKILNAPNYETLAPLMINSMRKFISQGEKDALELYADMSGMSGNLEKAYAKGMIYWHYVGNNFFANGDRDMILEHAAKIPASLRVTIVHGEEDVVCPIYHAESLKKAIAQSKLVTVPGVGHTLQSEIFFNKVKEVISQTID